MEVNHYAGKLAEPLMLVNVPKLVTAKIGRKLYEVSVGFKWFVDGLFKGEPMAQTPHIERHFRMHDCAKGS